MHKNLHIALIISTILILFNKAASSQDTSRVTIDTTATSFENVFTPQQILSGDTIRTDTVKKSDAGDIKAEIDYTAEDSLIFGMDNKKVYLYGDGKVSYQDMELTADYIEFDMTNNEVYATGFPDSTGEMAGFPHFKDGDQELDAKRLRYNFKTQKGYIEIVRTQQEGGYLHAEKTKKDELGHIHLKDGKYTTCDAEHPHFYLALTKAKSIPGDKIISGPAYLVLEDVPLPIGLPFGFFPNTRTNTSGLLIPSYGEERQRGFYLRNGGYYFAINDYMDLRVTGDIYTNGTWGVRVGSQYKLRYKFNGQFDVQYFKNKYGEKGLEDYYATNDYRIMWSHGQDAKANPNRTFRASVNLSSTGYDQNHSRDVNRVLTNTKSSSISYQKRWNNGMNFTMSANHSQNSNTDNINLNLPRATFSVPRFAPLKVLNHSDRKKWYEDIQISYTANVDNRIETKDSLLFTPHVWENMRNGFKHDIPVNWNLKFNKMRNFTFTPGFSYTGVAYTDYIIKRNELVYDEERDTSYYDIVEHTINEFSYAHAYFPRFSTTFSPKVYGTYTFKSPNTRFRQVRHVMSPTVSFSYVPDISKITPNYYREVMNEDSVVERYSIYEGKIYGTPTPSYSRSSKTMTFSLKNNIEAKIRPKSDTVEELKKIKLLDNLNFNTSLDFDDSIKFQPIRFNGNTRFFDGKLSLNFNGAFDPYATDSVDRRINKLEYNVSGKLARLTSATLSMNTRLQGGSKDGKKDAPPPQTQVPVGMKGPRSNEYDTVDEDYYGDYVDFEVPWSLNISYNLNYKPPTRRFTKSSIIQSFRFSGDVNLTPKWKIQIQTGYDVQRKEVTTSSMSIYRDLHCWEMRLTAIPFGRYKSFEFQINVKSALLQDLKYDKRIPWQDNL